MAKIWQASFDTVMLTFILDVGESPIKFLTGDDSNFQVIDGELKFDFDSVMVSVYLEDMSDKRGIIHSESH